MGRRPAFYHNERRLIPKQLDRRSLGRPVFTTSASVRAPESRSMTIRLALIGLCLVGLPVPALSEGVEINDALSAHALGKASSRAAGTGSEVVVPSAPAGENASYSLGSAYIPVDSWLYPAMLRLYSLGYVDTLFINMRPWTRLSVVHALEKSRPEILHGTEEAKEILASV